MADSRERGNHPQDREFRRDEHGIKRTLTDGKKPVWEKGGKYFRSYAEAKNA
jgi:hypothetical protein